MNVPSIQEEPMSEMSRPEGEMRIVPNIPVEVRFDKSNTEIEKSLSSNSVSQD